MLRIEPRRCAPCLAPDGLPSLVRTARRSRGTTDGPAAPARLTKSALPVAGDRGLAEGRRGYATALCFARLFDELARCSRMLLCLDALRWARAVMVAGWSAHRKSIRSVVRSYAEVPFPR